MEKELYDDTLCKSIGCQFYDVLMECNCAANEDLLEKCMNSQSSVRRETQDLKNNAFAENIKVLQKNIDTICDLRNLQIESLRHQISVLTERILKNGEKT